MSDPVKNAEVEDVLSSIRRLVSEEKRPLQAPPVASEAATDRLVLTPALRVEEPAKAPEAAPLILTQEAMEPQGDKAAEAVEAEPDTVAEPAAQDDDQELPAEAASEPDSPETGIENDYQDDPYNFDDEADTDGEGDLAAISAAVEAAKVDAPEEASPDAPQAETSEATSDTLAEMLEATASEDTAQVEPEEASPLSSDTASAELSAKIAALETAIGDISDDWEPDGASDEANAGTEPAAMAWEDDIAPAADTPSEPETVSERAEAIREVMAHDPGQDVQAAEAAAPDQPATAFSDPAEDAVDDGASEDTSEGTAALDLSSDDHLLDEDALRELVSDIVQTELQGALGERITRNVRRLVRREIHRALTARDLE